MAHDFDGHLGREHVYCAAANDPLECFFDDALHLVDLDFTTVHLLHEVGDVVDAGILGVDKLDDDGGEVDRTAEVAVGEEK